MTSNDFNPNPEIFRQMSDIEDEHWWFVARRMILDKLIGQLPLPKNADILEAGCGTGGSLAMLAKYGQVYAMDLTPVALDLAQARRIANVQRGCLPDDIPFADKRFDLIVSLDVLQSVKDDLAALQAMRQRLKPGSWLVLALPANPWMWSLHDQSWHNLRRYTHKGMLRLAKSAGFKVYYSTYFNSVLFPLIAAVRLLKFSPAYNAQETDQSMPPLWLNQLLTFLFSSERYLIGRVSIPFGVSLLLAGQKDES